MFVINNKIKCRIKYKNKEYELKEKFIIENINDEKLEIELIGVNNITDMTGMFNNCPVEYMSEFDSGNIIDMSYMFKNCRELTNVDFISKFNTEKVVYMTGML